MQPAPPASKKPRPRPQFTPSCASHPPPQTQCANTGYVQPASRAVDAQAAPNRQRSVPAPSGISAAKPTLNIWSNATSEAADPSGCNPRKKNGSAEIQFPAFPATVTTCAGPAANPCQENPQKKYTRTATARIESEESMEWAALRERPKPAAITASPAAAKGTRKISRTQRTVAVSDSPRGARVIS